MEGINIRDTRDVRGPLCGTIPNPWAGEALRIYISAGTLVRCRWDGVWERIQRRLRGEHVQIYPVKGPDHK